MVAVVHDEAGLVRDRMLRDLDLPFPVVVDRDRHGYRAYGLRRGSLRDVWSPGALVTYARGLVSRERIDRPGADPRQLGGDFVVDADGRVVFSHPQSSSDDRPPAGRLVECLEATARVGGGHS